MNIYLIVLFLHIAGALGFFVAQGLEWIALLKIRNTQKTEEARAKIGMVKSTNLLGAVSILTIVVTGIYMMLTGWGGAPWILVALGSFVLESVVFVALSRPRMAAIERALDTEESTLSKTFQALVNNPVLWISAYTRTAILLGIVYLMVARPGLGGSLLCIGIAIVLGLASALPLLILERVQARSPKRTSIALIAAAFAAVLVLIVTNSIIDGTIPLFQTKSGEQGAQTRRSEVSTSYSGTAPQEGPSILQARCTQCHTLQRVEQARKTRAEWEKTLSKMESFNAKISETEKQVLLDYLTTIDKP